MSESRRLSTVIPFVLAALSGVLFGCAFPNASIWAFAFVAEAPLLIALATARSPARAFLLGWVSQFVAWLIMVPWVVRVMSHYGGLPYLTGVLLFVAMALYLGLYGGVFGLLVHQIRPRERFSRWLLVPLAWAALEYLRTHLFTGFPWNLLAASIADLTPLIQISRFAGPYFVGCLVMLPSIVIAWLAVQPALVREQTAVDGEKGPKGAPGIVKTIVVGATTIVMFVWWVTGYVAAHVRPVVESRNRVTAALLQPNISQEMRWDEANVLAIYQRMMTMTETAVKRGATIVIWPESTVPLSFNTTPFYRDAIQALSRAYGIDIILGSVAQDAAQPSRIWNAAFLVSGGNVVGHYDKIRLVPFGEYVPLRRMLFFAEKLVRAVGEFEFGTSDRPLRGRFAYGPAICYEIVFPQITRAQVRNGADVLVTITNDAWYDGTSAPRQHLNQARLRAVEDDRYLLRSATTGISALVDPSGRIVEEIPMGREGTILAHFSPRTTRTPYVRFGDWFAWLSILAVLAGIALNSRR